MYYYPEKPQLITINSPLIDKWSHDSNWIAERKYNGIRLQLFWLDKKFKFFNRHGSEMSTFTSQFSTDFWKQLDAFSSCLKGNCLFDGELRHNKVRGVREKIILFDVFVWDGILLTNENFKNRRRILECLRETNKINIIRQFHGDFRGIFENIANIEHCDVEGMVLKNLNGKLNLSTVSSNDSTWMYKVRYSI